MNQNYFPIIYEDKLYLKGRLIHLQRKIQIINELPIPLYTYKRLKEKRAMFLEIKEINSKLRDYYII